MTQIRQHDRDNAREQTITDPEKVTAIVDAFNDPDTRAILEVTSEERLSAMDITDRCDLPASTTYRKVDQLTEIGLLAEETLIRSDGKHTSTYTSRITTAEFAIVDGTLELNLTYHRSTDESPSRSTL